MKTVKFAIIAGLFVSLTTFADEVTTDQLNELNVNYIKVDNTLTVLKTEKTAKVIDELALENVVDYATSFENSAKLAAFNERRKSRE